MGADNDLATVPNEVINPVPEVSPRGGDICRKEKSVTLTIRSRKFSKNYSSSFGKGEDGHHGVLQKYTVVSFPGTAKKRLQRQNARLIRAVSSVLQEVRSQFSFRRGLHEAVSWSKSPFEETFPKDM